MTNKEKYKSDREAGRAFGQFCMLLQCKKCRYFEYDEPCFMLWLSDEAEHDAGAAAEHSKYAPITKGESDEKRA